MKELDFEPLLESVSPDLNKSDKAFKFQEIKQAKSERKSELKEYAEKKVKMFGDLMLHVSTGSRDRLELHRKEFQEADSATPQTHF
jgi:hypothetical protein